MSTSTPPAKRLVPLWLAALPFIVLAVAVVAIQQWRRPTPPKDLTELAERIREKHSEWRIVPVNEKAGARDGFWVTIDNERNLRDLTLQTRKPKSAWEGSVCCVVAEEPPYPMNDGKHHVQLDKILLFGDSEMLRAILHDF